MKSNGSKTSRTIRAVMGVAFLTTVMAPVHTSTLEAAQKGMCGTIPQGITQDGAIWHGGPGPFDSTYYYTYRDNLHPENRSGPMSTTNHQEMCGNGA